MLIVIAVVGWIVAAVIVWTLVRTGAKPTPAPDMEDEAQRLWAACQADERARYREAAERYAIEWDGPDAMDELVRWQVDGVLERAGF